MGRSNRDFPSSAPRGAKGPERGKLCFAGEAAKTVMATGIVVSALAAAAGTHSEEVV